MGMLLFIAAFYGALAILGLKSSLTSQLRICALTCLTLPLVLAWEGWRMAAFLSIALPAYLYLVATRRDKAAAEAHHKEMTEALRVAVLKSEE